MFPKDITKWSSNDLMDKIESPEPEDSQGNVPGSCKAKPQDNLGSFLTPVPHNTGYPGGPPRCGPSLSTAGP